MPVTTRKLGGIIPTLYAATLTLLSVASPSTTAQVASPSAPAENTSQTNLLNAYRYAFQAYARDDAEAAAQEYKGEPGDAKRDTLRQQLNLTSDRFIPFQNVALDFRLKQGAFEDRVNEIVEADRASHPAAKRLSSEAAGKIRALSTELSKEESLLVDAIHQSLPLTGTQKLDPSVLNFYTSARANNTTPSPRPTPIATTLPAATSGKGTGVHSDVFITDPGGPDACNGLDPEEEADEEAACDLNGGNYSTSACTCLMPIYGGGGGGGGNSPTPADNTPIFTGIDPSVWISGSTTSVTFKGQYFGTNSPTLAFSPGAGIGYTLSSYNDSQIIATVNVATGTPNEDVGVSVTNNGYGGSAFYGGSSGASPTSAPVNARVQAPMNTPEITVVGWINGLAPDIVAAVNAGPTTPTLQNNLTGGSVTCLAQMLDWYTGIPSNLITSTDVAYANAWGLQQSANTAPPTTTPITPSVLQSAGNFRVFNDFGSGRGFFQIGSTPNPCGGIASWYSPAGQTNPNSGPNVSGSGQTYQLAEGRVGSAGQQIALTINNRTVPWIWSVIEFNSSNVPTYSQVGMFPSYTVYSNGNFVITYPQSTVASFILNNNTYQLTPSQIP